MAAELNKAEIDITKEIIHIGLSKAADSLSFFIKEKVLIKLHDLKIKQNYNPISKQDTQAKSYLLSTTIRGDISGKAYLVFNESEVDKLVDINLPESIKKDPKEKANMTDAVLLEIDNIITAAVITQFANILKCRLYGDVPVLNILPKNELNPFLNKENNGQYNMIYFNSRFITPNSVINSEFIWLMHDKFFTEVKNLVSDEKRGELLQKLNEINDA